jgi:N-methylhydantoinase B
MRLDPVSLEIMGRKLAAITDEMYFLIQRASRSSYVKEAADFATSILDLDGNVFAYPPSATFNFLIDTNYATLVRALTNIEPGDVIITNDPYLSDGMSTHLPDIHLLQPYFCDGRLVAWGWSFVHFADIGGAVASSMSPALTEIFQEGFRIPPMKIVRKGELNEDLIALIRVNSRTPDVAIGDLKAMLGALGTGGARLAELARKSGVQTLLDAAQDLQDYTAAKARDVLRRIPDGAYEFWDYLDDDMVSRIPVRVRCRMVARDGEIHLDLSGTDPQVKTAYNVPSMGKRMYWLTFRLTSFLTTFDPTMPKNAGMYRSISVNNPKGTILNAEFPDAVNVRASAPYRLFDAITGALIKAAPKLMPATTGGTMVPFALAELAEDGISRKVEVIEPLRCGMGAFDGRDGVDARDNSLNNMRNHPLETVESQSSVLVLDYDIRCDSGGPGKWRGGVGQMMTIEALHDGGTIVARGMERLRFPPWGVAGGRPGATLEAILNRGRPGERKLGKIHELPMAKGDTLTILLPGGGGYGDAFERDIAAVLSDVERGFVSLAAAERDYGVVIRAGRVDEAATAALRRARPRLVGRQDQIDVGEDRIAWEAVFDDETMLEINRRLYRLPKPARATLRRRLFETVVPGLVEPSTRSLAELIGDRDAARRRLREAMAQLLPVAAAA